MTNRGRQWHEGLSGLLPIHIRGILPSVSLAGQSGRSTVLENDGEAKFHHWLVEGVSLPNRLEPDVLLVDGQQRLTSLFQATTCGRVVSTMNIRKQPIKRWFYFDMGRALAGC